MKRFSIRVMAAVIYARLISSQVLAQNYELQFDQRDGVDYVEASQWLSGIQDNWTMEAWFWPEAHPTDNFSVIIQHRANYWDKSIEFHDDGRIRMVEYYGVSRHEFFTDPISLAEWHHVAMVSSASHLSFYLNGDSLASIEKTHGSSDWDASFYGSFIGGNRIDHSGDGLIGLIDEVRIWNTTRSEDEIQSDMYTELTGSESGLACYYDFNEGSGQVLTDRTLNGTDGELGNSPDPDTNDPIWTWTHCCNQPGDSDNNESADISDLTYYVTYMFDGGQGPICREEFDNDGNCTLDISDLTYYVEYLFGGGPAPVLCHWCP